MILFAVPVRILRPKRTCKRNQFFCQFMSLFSSSSAQSLDITEENNTHYPDYDELRRTMQNLAKSGGIHNALDVLRLMKNTAPGKPTIYDYNSLVNCYLKSENLCLHDLSALYSEMNTLILYPNASTFNTFLKGLNLLGESKIALRVIIQMGNYAFTPSFTSLSNLLKKSLNSMELLDAITILDLMMELNYVPTEPTLISLISTLSRSGMTEKACFVFFKLFNKGYFPTPYIYNPILWSLCKSDQILPALAFFCSLKKRGFVHNTCSYTALVYGFSKKGLFNEATHCLNKIATDGHCYPNVNTYTTIIKCLCDNTRVKEALTLLGQMEKRGPKPDIITYNIILRALSNRIMVFKIYSLFQAIYQKGLSPDSYTATALSGLLKRGNLGIVHSLLPYIDDIDVAVYNMLFYFKICGCESKKVCSLIKCMRKNGFKPNNITFNTILSAACKRGDTKMVEKVFDLMEYEGLELNAVGFTCLVQYFCNVGKVNDCLNLFEHMIFYGPRPSMVTVNTLVSGLCKNRELGAAYGVFCNLKSWGLSPDLKTYKILEIAAMKEGNDSLVAELQRKYRGRGEV